jgi:peptide deformylase
MFELMYEAKGIGLAASQVGILRRMFVCNTAGGPDGEQVFVNPVLEVVGPKIVAEEGCLSIPEVYAEVVRASRVRLRAQGLSAKRIEVEASDLPARVWQHEIDHLNGVLLVDRMSDSARLTNRRALRHLESKYHSR